MEINSTAIPKKRVIIVDDDPEIVRILREAFEMELPCSLTSVMTASAALEEISQGRFDLILLDLTLPDMSGIDLCRSLRISGIDTPIICLTSRADVVDRIVGLETGADDYVTKPFSPREVIARIKAVWRRAAADQRSKASGGSSSEPLEVGEIRIDTDARLVFISGKLIDLSRAEFDILLLFASNPGKVFPREKLLVDVLGYEISEYDQAITSHISRLRMKVEANIDEPVYIRTVRGVGYRFATLEELASSVRISGKS